jgi:hypothetical protein
LQNCDQSVPFSRSNTKSINRCSSCSLKRKARFTAFYAASGTSSLALKGGVSAPPPESTNPAASGQGMVGSGGNL